MTDQIHEMVRERYAEAANQAATGSGACCGPEEGIGAGLYSALEQAELPDAAVLASLGCGNPSAVAELREEGMHSVIARATKPMTTTAVAPGRAELPLAVASSGCGCGDGGCC